MQQSSIERLNKLFDINTQKIRTLWFLHTFTVGIPQFAI